MIATQKQKVQIIHQCAWCRSYIIDGNRIDVSDIDTSNVDSHGICEICACAMEIQCMLGNEE